jgi:hypothetical protein
MKRILIITSCTGEKAVESDEQLTLDDFRQGGAHLKAREKSLGKLQMPAADLYTGQHHVRLMRGINSIEGNGRAQEFTIDLKILSAGYGFVERHKKLPPYECTFQGMGAKKLDEWADALGTPEQFRKILEAPYDLALILLSDDYLRACRLNETVSFGGHTLLLCGNSVAKKLPNVPHLQPFVVSTPETKRFACGLLALKGEIGGRILHGLSEGDFTLAELKKPTFDLKKALDKASTQGSKTAVKKVHTPTTSLPKPRFTVHTPRKSAQIQYFIPEWDDRVDPNYDFQNDGITPDRDPYNHDVYAHEIYKKPNYDGILVSKSVIEDNQTKKSRIQAIGIHAHVRVPRSFPVMGDCGAFNYIDAIEPPYETEETVRFYQALDFDFGVSIDHLIVPQHMQIQRYVLVNEAGNEKRLTDSEFEQLKKYGVKVTKGRPSKKLFEVEQEVFTWPEDDLTEVKRRWKLTLENAEAFICEHKRQKATFVPIAGCQGWDVDSQTEMFAMQQDMGYSYIALGGLVRSQTRDIVEVLESVDRIRKPSTKIHLFGVARPEAIPTFMKLGVNSIDSARFLRQAWLSATSNYYSGDPTKFLENAADEETGNGRYTAIRIPPIYREGSTTVIGKAKKLVDEGHSVKELEAIEKKTLDLVHAFDRGEADLEETLAAIIEYDQLMGGNVRNEPLYRQLLEDKPWKQCPCDVCQATGIDVVVFRRNNRNRRRGFHNTWWFFEYFKDVTTAERVGV